MKIQSPFLFGLAGLLGTAAIRAWMGTLECKAACYDRAMDPASPLCRGQKIYIFWHEYILLPLYLRGHCNLTMLLSRHRDAEVLSRVARQMGFAFVRGSTQRGGVAALRELVRQSRRMHLTLTPDGPRGPRRRMAPGPIYLASKLGLPLVVMGFGYERPWRVTSAWDQFAIPRPYSRARAVVSPEIPVPPDLDREGLEHYRRRIEALQNRLCGEAEAWAESGAPRTGEFSVEPVLARGNAERRNEGSMRFLVPPLPLGNARSGPSASADADGPTRSHAPAWERTAGTLRVPGGEHRPVF